MCSITSFVVNSLSGSCMSPTIIRDSSLAFVVGEVAFLSLRMCEDIELIFGNIGMCCLELGNIYSHGCVT